MTANTPATRKDKGRKFQQKLARDIQTVFNLDPDDVVSRSMGAPGADIMLSPHAQKAFPFAVECKRAEKVTLTKWWEQTQQNADKCGLKPLLVFRQNRSDALVCMRWEDFIKLMNNKEAITDLGFV